MTNNGGLNLRLTSASKQTQNTCCAVQLLLSKLACSQRNAQVITGELARTIELLLAML